VVAGRGKKIVFVFKEKRRGEKKGGIQKTFKILARRGGPIMCFHSVVKKKEGEGERRAEPAWISRAGDKGL